MTRAKHPKFKSRLGILLPILLLVILAGAGYFFSKEFFIEPLRYESVAATGTLPEVKKVFHLPPPESVKAIYMTSWVAGTPSLRDRLISLLDETELNAVVIDIKDYTGRIAFPIPDPEITASGVIENRVPNIESLINDLHARDIYVIGRVSVFQDVFFTKLHPDLAVRRLSDGGVWGDRKGISWLEVGAKPVWDYVIRIARAAEKVGFDEINFDYIRFPSDGNMRDIDYHFTDLKTETRAAALESFYKYLSAELSTLGIPISADLFGLTTTSLDDLGIGQVIERAAPYFDYIAPMVYPSHFASGFLNFSNPAEHPYEVVNHSMRGAVERLNLSTASSTEKYGAPFKAKLRPWLQDFNLGATYTPAMVRAQIQATYDAGLDSWMLWDPNNRYTREALY